MKTSKRNSSTNEGEAFDPDALVAFEKLTKSPGSRPKFDQERVLRSILQGQSVLFCAPTGYGKSIIYLMAAVLSGKKVLIVSPLVSLAEDQFSKYAELLSGLDKNLVILDSAGSSDLNADVIIATPEKLAAHLSPHKDEEFGFQSVSSYFRNFMSETELIVFDEVHCMLSWTQEFRSAYGDALSAITSSIIESRITKASPTVLGLSATIDSGLSHILKIFLSRVSAGPEPIVIASSEPWEVPPLMAVKCQSVPAMAGRLLQIAKLHLNRKQNGIVFSPTIEEASMLYGYCKSTTETKSISIFLFHGQLSAPEKREILIKIGKCQGPMLVFGTSALGMGIDHDFDFSIHAGFPYTDSDLLQQMGRVGRKKGQASCYLLYMDYDIKSSNRIAFGTKASQDLPQICSMLAIKRESPFYTKDADDSQRDRSHASIAASELLRLYPSYGSLFHFLVSRGVLKSFEENSELNASDFNGSQSRRMIRRYRIDADYSYQLPEIIQNLQAISNHSMRWITQGEINLSEALQANSLVKMVPLPRDSSVTEKFDSILKANTSEEENNFKEWLRHYYFIRNSTRVSVRVKVSYGKLCYTKPDIQSVTKKLLRYLTNLCQERSIERIAVIIQYAGDTKNFADSIHHGIQKCVPDIDGCNKEFLFEICTNIGSEVIEPLKNFNPDQVVLIGDFKRGFSGLRDEAEAMLYLVNRHQVYSTKALTILGWGAPSGRMSLRKNMQERILPEFRKSERQHIAEFLKNTNLTHLALGLYYVLDYHNRASSKTQGRILNFLLRWLELYRYFILMYDERRANEIVAYRISILNRQGKKQKSRASRGTESELRAMGFVAIPHEVFRPNGQHYSLDRDTQALILENLARHGLIKRTTYFGGSKHISGRSRMYALNLPGIHKIMLRFVGYHADIFNLLRDREDAVGEMVDAIGLRRFNTLVKANSPAFKRDEISLVFKLARKYGVSAL